MLKKVVFATCASLALTGAARADSPRAHSCDNLPNWSHLKSALQAAVTTQNNGGLGFNMWATIVANDGTVCAVAFSGGDYKSQWLASRVISAQKANTANGLSLSDNVIPSGAHLFNTGLALSTANLYSAVQPGGSLFGLQFSNPVDPTQAYFQRNGQPDDPTTFGQANDPMVGLPIGGVNVFGGGLGLYWNGQKVGGLGVSGDTSCTDHFVAWRTRNNLQLDFLKDVGGVAGALAGDPTHPDNIIFDITNGVSATGFGHPACVNSPSTAQLTGLPPVRTH